MVEPLRIAHWDEASPTIDGQVAQPAKPSNLPGDLAVLSTPEHGARLLYTVAEAAAMLAMSERECWRKVRSGELGSVRTGPRKPRVTVGQLAAYVAQLESS